MVHARRIRGLTALGAAALAAACDKPPQLLVIVDTDAPLTAQAALEPSISPAAVIDTVRFDRLDEASRAVCIDEVDCAANVVLPDPSLWPFSFGVATPSTGSAPLLLRIRAFRGAVAVRGQGEVGGRTFSTIDPPAEATIDRLVSLTLPASGEQVVRLELSADCLGAPISLRKPAHTCVDGARRAVDPSAGIAAGGSRDLGATRAGTWPSAREILCSAAPPRADAVCIAGGFSVMGEPALAGVDEQSSVAAAPPRPVHVSPFFMDRVEFTVGRFRALVNAGLVTLPAGSLITQAATGALADCRWLGASSGANDDYPINCLTWSLAQRACAASGGDLPTEAQWEHAARGRGQGRVYPWGDASPTCCTASAARGTLCPVHLPDISGPEKVGSHPPSACDGIGDISRDGVLDLGGNVVEFCADALVAYGQGCWSTPGIFIDPRCADATTLGHAARGGDWQSGNANTRSAFRRTALQDPQSGFRCVYKGVAP